MPQGQTVEISAPNEVSTSYTLGGISHARRLRIRLIPRLFRKETFERVAGAATLIAAVLYGYGWLGARTILRIVRDQS